ncbi:MAG: ABC transporter substrate-binding protein [Lachnospirales bacterium]
MKLKWAIIGVFSCFAMVGCANNSEVVQENIAVDETDVVTSVEETTIIDREGNEIEIPSEVNSIVSLAPGITETLVDLGIGEKIVGTDSYSYEVEGVEDDTMVFDILAPDIETLATLEPDLILVSGLSQEGSEDPLKALKELGITITYIPSSNSFDGIKEDILFLGDITRESERAEEIVVEFQSEIDNIVEKLENVESEDKKVYFEISPAPYLYTFGNGVFLQEMIDILHLENIFSEQESWVPVTEEEIFTRNPEIIFTNTYLENPVEEIYERVGWDVLDAVKNEKVYMVDTDTSSRPNEFVVEALKSMASSIYPEVFE